jgi:DNA-binding transcriptional LysR family regulator
MESMANPLPGSELAAFVAALEAGSVHGAADKLQLTQSAVTKRLQTLERRVGDRLLDRGRFGVRPTELGRTLYPAAKRALESLEEVAETVASARSAGRDLRLSASYTIGECLLPGWLADFRHSHPEIHPQLEVVNSAGVLAALRERRSEIGFIEGLDDPESMQTLTVARDEIVVAVNATHPWARRRAINPQDLTREAYLTREANSGTRAVATAALAAAGVALTPSLQAASAQSLKRALTGGGFTLISRLVVAAEVRAGTLVTLPVRGVELRRELRAIAPRRPALTGPARAFWRWLETRTRAPE